MVVCPQSRENTSRAIGDNANPMKEVAMRLGKRERATLREKDAAKALARKRAREPEGRFVNMWSRFFPILRPVGKPAFPWHYRGVNVRRISRKVRIITP